MGWILIFIGVYYNHSGGTKESCRRSNLHAWHLRPIHRYTTIYMCWYDWWQKTFPIFYYYLGMLSIMIDRFQCSSKKTCEGCCGRFYSQDFFDFLILMVTQVPSRDVQINGLECKRAWLLFRLEVINLFCIGQRQTFSTEKKRCVIYVLKNAQPFA